MYELTFLPGAAHYLKKLKENGLKEKFKLALAAISHNPYQGEMKIGDLADIYCYNFYYKKIVYEIAYRLYDEKQSMVVILAGTRENFYNQLKRYIK